MARKIVTVLALEPVSLDEAKSHCRVDIDTDDVLIASLVAVARETVEGISRRALISQTWDLVLDDWPDGDKIVLPLPPLQSVTGVYRTDEDGNETEFTRDDYIADTYSEPGRVVLKSSASWPSTTLQAVNGVRVRFVAGFGDTGGDVPAKYRQAILLLVGHWYEHRESVVSTGAVPKEIPAGVQALLWLDRNLGFE